MSRTQQEIATPKVCKPYKKYLCALSFAIVCIALGITGCLLLRNSTVAIYAIVISLLCILTAVFLTVFRNRIAVITALSLLTCGITALLIVDFAIKQNVQAIILTAVISIVLIGSIIFIGNMREKKMPTTRYITYAATFVALSVVFKMLGNTVSTLIPIPNMRLSFVYIPWVFSGIVLGPLGGCVCGLLGDLIGQLAVAVGGAPNPLTLLSNALFPLFPALFYHYLPLKSNKLGDNTKSYIKIFIGMALSLAVCTLGIGSYALYTLWGYDQSMGFFTYLLTIRSPQIIILAINYVLIVLLFPQIKRLNLTDALFKKEKGSAEQFDSEESEE